MNKTAPQIAYLDCFSGISGDMLLGALIDAGLPLEVLTEQLALLPLSGYRLSVEDKKSGALRAKRVTVAVEEKQPHRTWVQIRAMIEDSALSPGVKEKTLAVFAALAEAEGRVHGVPPEKVHFHEVGAADSIVDIVGAAIGLEYLGITRLIGSPLPMGRGWVECAHGKLPLPGPAVVELLKGVPSYGVDLEQELVTPTGAAIAKALCREFGPMPPMTIQAVGYGSGTQQLANGQPNLLRLILGQGLDVQEAQTIEVIETHLDDWAPEGFPYLCEQLFNQQALDVALAPIQMKKGRPGFLLTVLADPAHALALKQCILSETTAIGLRFHTAQRLTLPRQLGTVATPWGAIGVKRVETPAGVVLYPEYESCRSAAEKHSVPLKQIYAHISGLAADAFIPQGHHHG
ncbi:MAG TPA: nickel pincer cofactor biosynthesis protein LarC [Desulfurivibrionaceae bacterium]|nr:nickel pincer cofactor biosynthesis protein LarC [Desulfurivibrionaceae bacterium]